jgi:hypothetical protein
MSRALRRAGWLVVASILGMTTVACNQVPVDYSAFNEHAPRSILVLPPVNHSIEVFAGANFLTTVSQPIGEAGYYVFPVAIVQAFMQENGLPTADEMHGVQLSKLREVFGADAVLYLTVEDWGQKFHVLSSDTVVSVSARLVDLTTGALLWSGSVRRVDGTQNNGDILSQVINAVIEQVIDSKSDVAHGLAHRASLQLFRSRSSGLPPGWRHPNSGRETNAQ